MTTAAAAQDVLAAYREALDGHDGQALLRVYADDAVVLAYSERNRPASPQRIEGRQAIDAWLTDVMSRNLTHRVSDDFAAGDRFAFRETCVYPSGEHVVGTYVCKVRDGQIVEQIGVEAWDELAVAIRRRAAMGGAARRGPARRRRADAAPSSGRSPRR